MNDAMERIANTQLGVLTMRQKKLDELEDLGRTGAYLSQNLAEAEELCQRLAEDIQRNDKLIQSLKNEILSKHSPSELDAE